MPKAIYKIINAVAKFIEAKGRKMEVTITEREPKAASAIVALQMPERLRQAIRKEAYEKEMSFSAMVRRILEEHYAPKEDAE